MPNCCLICERVIEADEISVHGATIWTSSGNYGSTVYDPASEGVYLEVHICDECLVRKKGLIEEVVVHRVEEEIERRPPSF